VVYKYKGLDKAGVTQTGRIEAPTLDDAKKRLAGQDLLIEWVKLSGEGLGSKFATLRVKKLSVKQLASFSKNLSIYLKAGVPILKAIHLLKSNVTENKVIDFLTAIETMIEEGKSFYSALESQKAVELPSFYTQSVKVAEENGLLEGVLVEMADFLQKQSQMSKQVKKALTYPMFIMLISMIMVGVMLAVVVPKITLMLEQMDKEVPPLTSFVIGAGDFVSSYWLLVLIGATLFGYTFGWLKKNNYRFKLALNQIVLRLPLLGKLVRTSELARFSYTTSMLLRSGVPFVHAVKLASNILENLPIKEKLEEASKYVVEGKRFSQALVKAKFNYDRSFLQAVALGEETSELIQMLENLSLLYEEQNKDFTDTFLGLLEPMMILVVGLIMGVIVAAMLLPIFTLNIGG
jgi:type IV pilus assembly protein PilC